MESRSCQRALTHCYFNKFLITPNDLSNLDWERFVVSRCLALFLISVRKIIKFASLKRIKLPTYALTYVRQNTEMRHPVDASSAGRLQ